LPGCEDGWTRCVTQRRVTGIDLSHLGFARGVPPVFVAIDQDQELRHVAILVLGCGLITRRTARPEIDSWR
jgi:hypothetical protein